ncbi:MAG: histidine phosphatase family protein, partial [Chloroflexales bacterium]|nr:histidine phosphatase family protein [Chloroflexales bacterium]
MRVTTLYLVRHAHASWTPDEGRALSSEGRAGASHVAALLCGEPIAAVYASKAQRTEQTVTPLAEALGLTVRTVKKLRERRLSAEPVDDHAAAVAWCWAHPEAALPGGESNREAQRRGVKIIAELASRHAGEVIVVGTHGNLLALILQHFQPGVDYAFWRQLTMPDIYALT